MINFGKSGLITEKRVIFLERWNVLAKKMERFAQKN